MQIQLQKIAPKPAPAPVEETDKIDLLGMNRAELIEFAGLIGQPAFRGKQLYHWLYAEREAEIEAMTDLPAALRKILPAMTTTDPLKVVKEQHGFDGSLKLLLETEDHLRVEAVLIPEGERLTACLSSQVGCAVGCTFCATGKMGFKRNLLAGEIIAQLFAIERVYGRRMTNVVMMGMGEPLLNRPALFRALPILTDPDGVGLSRRHVTVSTAGWLPGIKAMTKAVLTGKHEEMSIEELREQGGVSQPVRSKPAKPSEDNFPRVKLAISLNATTDDKRSELMPLAGRYPLREVLAAAAEYYEASKERVSINYLLLAGKNDSDVDAKRLAYLARDEAFKVGIMEYNDIGVEYVRADSTRLDSFVKVLTDAGIDVTVRTSRGGDITAACGQLAGEYEKGM